MNSKSDTIDAEKLRKQLLTLKDQNGDHVISSLIATDPAKLHALIEFTQALLLREREKEVQKWIDRIALAYQHTTRVMSIKRELVERKGEIKAELSRLSGEDSHE